MTKAQHTPGPWKRGKFPGDIENQDGDSIAIGLSPKSVGGLFQIQAPVAAKTIDEAHANIRLMIAAPELLQIAEGINEKLDLAGHECGEATVRLSAGELEVLRAAIAKATGQAA